MARVPKKLPTSVLDGGGMNVIKQLLIVSLIAYISMTLSIYDIQLCEKYQNKKKNN